jgi:FdhE protein
MRQGEVAAKGKWQGRAQGGVSAPKPLILPDPSQRFADTAARLDGLASGHLMQDWLRFMSRVAQGQHMAANTLAPGARPPLSAVAQAVAARLPPLAADSHRRDPSWREALTLVLDSVDAGSVPREALAVAERLCRCDADAIESMADAFLNGQVRSEDAGLALYVAAALQVYFTCLAASLPASALRLLPQRNLCPCCGSPPSAGLVTASGQTPRARYLYCSLCSTAWNHVRAVCITCGEARELSLQGIDGDAGIVKAETCTLCQTYAKMLYQAKDTNADPFADDLASLGLDILVAEAGFARHAPNALLLVG